MKLQRFQGCIDLGIQALADIDRFHFGNDVWITRAIALSKSELGDRDSAVAELQGLLARKPDWFIHKEIAQLQYEQGRTDEAIRSAAAANWP